MSTSLIGTYLARGVLFLLVLIHWILPFTPVNQNPEPQIFVGSIILGGSFLFIGIKSITQPRKYFTVGLALLFAVYAISALTGASPLAEGLVVKVLFAVLLITGIVFARATNNITAA